MTERDDERLMRGWSTAMSGNFSVLNDICAPECEIWHSSDNRWILQRDAMDAFIAAHDAGRIPPFEEVRIMPTAKGFLCQASMTMQPIGRIHLIQLLATEGGRIVRVEEYISPEMDLATPLAA
ncbi:hypothetical protein F9288_13940 [Sphingomonas sp. CL5.1]|uniref:hypothetical protein n=1 Tax=Sphingomonas sp. CL5.1 TaxID=2653203 RepID=UPI00158422CD|nr:hypothetical protein [Sphingomonas sp. CL5.1]QKS00600.1 hypothetical protein F9288_13940 [Sphingomonas sp. CL5.1]